MIVIVQPSPRIFCFRCRKFCCKSSAGVSFLFLYAKLVSHELLLFFMWGSYRPQQKLYVVYRNLYICLRSLRWKTDIYFFFLKMWHSLSHFPYSSVIQLVGDVFPMIILPMIDYINYFKLVRGIIICIFFLVVQIRIVFYNWTKVAEVHCEENIILWKEYQRWTLRNAIYKISGFRVSIFILRS